MTEDDSVAHTHAVVTQRWDVDALRAGAAVCVTLTVPLRLLAVFVGGDSTGLNALFFALLVTFFVIGAGCAAWIQRAATPLSHALVTAIGTFVALEAVFVLIRLVRGTTVPWLAIFFTLSVISVAGLLGGFLGSRLQAKGFVPSSRR